MERYDATSKQLQSATMDMNTTLQLSLSEFVQSVREQFADIEQKAKLLSQCEQYKGDSQNKRRRKRNPKFDGDVGSSQVDSVVNCVNDHIRPLPHPDLQ
jgi:hypothetical protein